MKIGIRELILSLLLIAVPLAAWWFVFKPNDELNASMIEQIETRRAKLNELNRATGMIGNLQREISSLEGTIEVLQSKLPSGKEIDKVIQEIWYLARKNNLTPVSVKTLNKDSDKIFTGGSGGQYSEQPVSIIVGGNFMGFYTFLQDLESRPRIMRIYRLAVIKEEKIKDAPEGYIRAEFAMSIFFDNNKAQL